MVRQLKPMKSFRHYLLVTTALAVLITMYPELAPDRRFPGWDDEPT